MKTATMGMPIGRLAGLQPRSDALMAAAVIGMLAVILIPLPSPLLDILIAFNIAMSVIILLVSLYVLAPLNFSVFPTLLLLFTLFRLSLNVASTRLILLHGSEGSSAAGRVIEAFGQFVVGGNYVVGVVIFLVLIAIQYIVVNHGAVRISEVTARFTLDAMPGKQMSIDADLNAGLIDEREARQRRDKVAAEAEFYGAMDGAVRFTQRDAVAGIIITLINILAGFAIGVGLHGMDLSAALETFTVLTIGDGLVSAIPSLLISITAGIMTTRAANQTNLSKDVGDQLFNNPKPVAMASGALFLLALVPGLPTLSFLILSGAVGSVAYYAHRQQKTMAHPVTPEDEELQAEQDKKEERMEQLMRLDPLGLELGYQLIQLVDNKGGADFLGRVKSIRRQIALDLGMIVPPVHITDNLQLNPKEYRILLKGVEIARAELIPEQLMAIDPGQTSGSIDGTPTQEPTFQLPALWIKPENREKAQLAGYTVVDNTTVLATHLTEVVKSHLHELLGRQEVKTLIDNVNETHPKVVEELIPKVLNVGQVQKVLQNLLRERVSIRDMVTILETLADYAPMTKNVSLLTEYARQSLGRSICQQHMDGQGRLKAFTLSPEIERTFSEAVTVTEQDSYLALDPQVARELVSKIHSAVEQGSFDGYPLLLTSSEVRLHLKRLVERVMPSLVVISHNEIPPHARVSSLGVIER
ncbi:MAG TPA: flagellar biosynthesis protein FlhA [Acidobacteriota bacterium]|nr:flagellar biosynthesis protein FlhA [Acidobacteriota bacterium]